MQIIVDWVAVSFYNASIPVTKTIEFLKIEFKGKLIFQPPTTHPKSSNFFFPQILRFQIFTLSLAH